MDDVLHGFTPGNTFYYITTDPSGDYWNDVLQDFENLDPTGISNYAISMPEDGVPSGFGIYRGAYPTGSNMASGVVYDVSVWQQLGGSVVSGDPYAGGDSYTWDGDKLRTDADMTAINSSNQNAVDLADLVAKLQTMIEITP